MYDDDIERRRVIRLFEKYNREGLSATVDAEFVELARERAHRHPFRQYVLMPLSRLQLLWTPIPPYEMSMRVPWLGMPRGQRYFGYFEELLFALALIGGWLAHGRDRLLFWIVILVVGARSLLHSTAAHPSPTERYLAEAVPFLLLFVALAADSLLTILIELLAHRQWSSRLRDLRDRRRRRRAFAHGRQGRAD